MLWNGYELSNYTDDDIPEIVKLLVFLWGPDEASNMEYFNWKLQKNPFFKKSVGVVAKHDDKVVGFWGFIPNEWEIKGEKIPILNSCDTIIHTEHRGKGLYTGMLKYIMREYRKEYRYFIAFTANQLSTPAAIKVGWKPLFQRNYLRHLNVPQLIRSRMFINDTKVFEPGIFKDIEVSYTIRSNNISRIDSKRTYRRTKLTINKTPGFIEWKLSNSRSKYIYFYHFKESEVDAYLILSIQGSHMHVIDYGEDEGSYGIQSIFNFIIDHTKSASISFLTASMPENFRSFLKTKHFYNFDRVEKKVKRKSYNLPILIRPVIDDYKENDWYISDIDIRKIDNWHITEICFD